MPGKDIQIVPLLPVTVYGRVFNCCYFAVEQARADKNGGPETAQGRIGPVQR